MIRRGTGNRGLTPVSCWERGHLARINDWAGGASTSWAGEAPALPERAACAGPSVHSRRHHPHPNPPPSRL